MTRLNVLLPLAALVCTFSCWRDDPSSIPSATPAAADCRGCNLILVTFDALRADHLGAYGYPRPTSPVIDALARESVVFTRSVSQAPSTLASIPSLHTSKFARADRLLDDGVLRPAEHTLAEMLHESGYTTMAVIAHSYASCHWGSCAGFEASDDQFRAPEAAPTTRMRVERMLRAKAQEPFFLWVHTRQPHEPYDPPESAYRAFYDGNSDDLSFYSPEVRNLELREAIEHLAAHYQQTRGEPTQLTAISGRRYHATPTILRQLQAMYDASIAEIDRQFGILLEGLREQGLLERTVIILSADHGEGMGELRILDHNIVIQGVIHTPLILHVPGAEPGRIDHPVMNVDILPTALRVLGLPAPDSAKIRGRDLFAPRPPDYFQYSEGSLRAVVRGHFKLIGEEPSSYDGAHPDRLFDLSRDPLETRDVASLHPEIAGDLRKILEGIYADNLSLDPSAPDTDVMEKLRELGYIE